MPPGVRLPPPNRSPALASKHGTARHVSVRSHPRLVRTNAGRIAAPARSPIRIRGRPVTRECCDNACCFGTCYGEELCCATNNRGTAAPSNRICEISSGPECCLYSDECCTIDGCCATTCYGGADGESYCCDAANYCPGGSESPELCCTGDTPIKCACGTNANTCIADTDAACCVDADCDTPPSGSSPCAVGTCVANVCQYTDCNAETEICCPDNLGVYACRVGDECCLTNETCADTCEACVNFVCVDDPVTFPCGPANDPDKYCCPGSNYSICCGASQFECCGVDAATGVTRECDADGKCCEAGTPYFCAGSNTCCSAPCVTFGEAEYCCPPGRGRICDGADSFVCCPNGQECSDDGECCPAGTVAAATHVAQPGTSAAPTRPAPTATAARRSGNATPMANAARPAARSAPATAAAARLRSAVTASVWPPTSNAAAPKTPATVSAKPAVNGACVDDQDKCFGACGVCVDGTCQGDESLCLNCEICRFNPAHQHRHLRRHLHRLRRLPRDRHRLRTAPACRINTECLSCQVCRLDAMTARRHLLRQLPGLRQLHRRSNRRRHLCSGQRPVPGRRGLLRRRTGRLRL